VPYWIGQAEKTAGQEIQRLIDLRGGATLVEHELPTRGPYRLRPTDVAFLPSRTSANELLAIPIMTRKLQKGARGKKTFFPGELHAYDLLIQRGVFMTAVTDLIVQRVAAPETIPDARERLIALKIYATYLKLQLRLAEAAKRADEGLALARRLKANDEIAYFLDQLGGIFHMSFCPEDAVRYFREEIAFLDGWASERALYHLAGAWRGLAGALRGAGDTVGAEAAIQKSAELAERSKNGEASQLAEIERARLGLAACAAAVPTEHLTGRLMALNAEAEARLEAGERSEGERLLHIAHAEAIRLSHPGEAAKALATASKFTIDLFPNAIRGGP
jgi:tetratricopeptide (TPR) repeat protein